MLFARVVGVVMVERQLDQAREEKAVLEQRFTDKLTATLQSQVRADGACSMHLGTSVPWLCTAFDALHVHDLQRCVVAPPRSS